MKCQKVTVKCIIYSQCGDEVAYGSNIDPTGDCERLGCLKKRKYGEDSSEHRNPADCNSIHAEIVALMKLAQVVHAHRFNTLKIWVSRYPCEACVRTIMYFSELFDVNFELCYDDSDGEMSDQSKEMWTRRKDK